MESLEEVQCSLERLQLPQLLLFSVRTTIKHFVKQTDNIAFRCWRSWCWSSRHQSSLCCALLCCSFWPVLPASAWAQTWQNQMSKILLEGGGDSDVHDRVREYEPSHIDMLSISCGMHLHGDSPYSPYCLLTYKSLSILERDLYVGRQRTSLQYQ